MKLALGIVTAFLAVITLNGCSGPVRVTDQFFENTSDKSTVDRRQQPRTVRPLSNAGRNVVPAEQSLDPSPDIQLVPFSQNRSSVQGINQTHTVRKGETLTELARRFYDNPKQWRRIYNANRGAINNPDTLPAGTQLRIPPLP